MNNYIIYIEGNIFLFLYIFCFMVALYFLFVEINFAINDISINNRTRIPIYFFLSEIMISTGKSISQRKLFYDYFNNSFSRFIFLFCMTISFGFLIFIEIFIV